ncbi:MAG: hypothetical protein BAA01_08605 [Bacillus thermozeamaize]|uniref:AB hydrolase-1 domain-containing protein n=1 Tax=Bacillus thermozeamaize TaxID=230954 RepID=A0A1Y3PST0_9BACI|nr:MAG: hypothetical protein BAA01_08605 [Bacillus thermozeamaize]
MLVNMEKRRMYLKNKAVAYIDQGENSSEPVLLLHGVPESSLLWKEIIPVIVSSGFRAIAPDLPGFGQSERFDEPCTWERYLQFVTEFTESLKIGKFHLVVHDWGGLIGLKWACEHPERILSLIVSDSTLSPEYRWHPIARKWRKPGEGEEVMEKYADRERWMAAMKREIPSADEEILNDFYRVLQTHQNRQVILDLYRSANHKLVENHEKLSQLKVPVTILWGENDPYIHSDFAYKLREYSFHHAEVHVIPDAGHFIHVEVPEKVKALVAKHFASL